MTTLKDNEIIPIFPNRSGQKGLDQNAFSQLVNASGDRILLGASSIAVTTISSGTETLRPINIIVPQGLIEVGDIVRVRCYTTCDNNINDKALEVLVNTNAVFKVDITDTAGVYRSVDIAFPDVTEVHIFQRNNALGVGTQDTIDETNANLNEDTQITIAHNYVVAGDSMTTVSYTIELIKQKTDLITPFIGGNGGG